jgi:arylsulfatase A-like enzyme
MNNRNILLLHLTVLVLLVGGCTVENGNSERPNILLITLDTARADHLSAYGYQYDTTPFLRELAARGAYFKRVYAAAPATAPSHATLFTSQSPLTHRVVKNAVTLAEDSDTLAELLVANGYQTAAIVSSFVLNAKFGLAQGFQHYDDELDGTNASIHWHKWEGQEVVGGFDRNATEATDKAVAWLEHARDPKQPFLLFVHYFDPHDPYLPPPKYRGRFSNSEITQPYVRQQVDYYDGEIAYTDDQLRRLLDTIDRLKLDDDTIVIVTGDHGEGIWQRGYQYHGAHIYEEAVRVPLIVHWPGRVMAGSAFEKPVTLADVTPTIFELIGLDSTGRNFQGRSLAQALRSGQPLTEDQPAFIYRVPYDPHHEFGVWVDGEKHGVRYQRWKYLVSDTEGTTELYDLFVDPGETRNLVAKRPEWAKELGAMLTNWRETVSQPDSLTIMSPLSTTDLQKLKSLGYVR